MNPPHLAKISIYSMSNKYLYIYMYVYQFMLYVVVYMYEMLIPSWYIYIYINMRLALDANTLASTCEWPRNSVNKNLRPAIEQGCGKHTLPKTSARPSDARPATAASRFTGVLLCCALCLHISRSLAEPHGVRRRRQYDHAARCSSAPRQVHLRALDLLSSPC